MKREELMRILAKEHLKNVSVGWFEWQIKGNRLKFSDEIHDRFGFEDGMTIEDIALKHMNKEDSRHFMENVRQTLASGRMMGNAYRATINGSQRWLKIDGTTEKDEEGKIVKIIGYVFDITDQTEMKDELETAANFYEAMMETISIPIFYKDVNGIYLACNEAFCDLLGYDEEQVIGKTVHDMTDKRFADIYVEKDRQVIESKTKTTYEARVKANDGRMLDMMISKSTHLSKDGKVLGIVGLMYDVTARKYNESLIEKQNMIKDVIIDLSQRIQEFENESDLYDQLIVQLLDVFQNADSGTVLNVTEQKTLTIAASSQYDQKVIEGFEIELEKSFIWHHTHGQILKPGIVNNIDELTNKFDIPERLRNKSQEVLRSNLFIPLTFDGKLDKIVSLDSNKNKTFNEFDLKLAGYIQEQIKVIHQLFGLYQATILLSRYDGLTGFMNRGYFEAIFEDRIQLAIRSGIAITVIMFDLDDLKIVNDTFGHDVGDDYIRQFAYLIKQAFRTSDQMGRLGGDEFCCTFIDSDVARIIEKIEDIREVYGKDPFGHKSMPFKGRFSYGVAKFPEDGLTTYDLMKKADFQMYLDKKNYKQRNN